MRRHRVAAVALVAVGVALGIGARPLLANGDSFDRRTDANLCRLMAERC